MPAEPIRVVLVDDHPHMRRLSAVWLLEDARFRLVGEADDGPAAAELVERIGPDAVVLDLRLPSRSGLVALEHLRQRASLPVVVVNADEDGAVEARSAGADAVFIKGDPLIEVLDTMAELVAGDSADRS